MIAQLLATPLARFGLVSVVGLGVDLSAAWTLATLAGLPLPLAALCGFVLAAALNYVLHERWTFGGGGALSARRGSLYLAVLAVTLGVRVGSVAALERVLPAGAWARLAVLVLATGLSFLANYALSRRLVFRASAAERGA